MYMGIWGGGGGGGGAQAKTPLCLSTNIYMYLGIGERFELCRHLVEIWEKQASGRKETSYPLF